MAGIGTSIRTEENTTIQVGLKWMLSKPHFENGNSRHSVQGHDELLENPGQ